MELNWSMVRWTPVFGYCIIIYAVFVLVWLLQDILGSGTVLFLQLLIVVLDLLVILVWTYILYIVYSS